MANLRVYQAWKGTNIFLCNGRLVFGPDAGSVIPSILLTVVPSIIFCIFVVRNRLHKFPSYNAGYWILAVTIVFTVYVLVLLLLTSARDPGIIPRSSQPPEEILSFQQASAEGGLTPSMHRSYPRFREVFVNGLPVRVKYCETCMLYRPARCSHCSICDNCVEKFDHHCPWIGQCVAKRNYRFYFMFISSATLLCIYIFAMSVLYIKFLMDDHHSFFKAVKESPASIVLIIYSFLSLWFVGGLTGFHSYLISTNQTTYENFRQRTDHRRNNPYNRGCINNFLEVFCTKISPSKIKFRSLIQEAPPEMIAHSDVDGQAPLDREESQQSPRTGSFETSQHILASNDSVSDSRRG